jgi:hypothetical protein
VVETQATCNGNPKMVNSDSDRPALGPQPASYPVGTARALSLRAKRPGSEADRSPASSAEVKNEWSYTSTPPIRLHGVVFS